MTATYQKITTIKTVTNNHTAAISCVAPVPFVEDFYIYRTIASHNSYSMAGYPVPQAEHDNRCIRIFEGEDFTKTPFWYIWQIKNEKIVASPTYPGDDPTKYVEASAGKDYDVAIEKTKITFTESKES